MIVIIICEVTIWERVWYMKGRNHRKKLKYVTFKNLYQTVKNKKASEKYKCKTILKFYHHNKS